MPRSTTTLAELARTHAGASRVFQRYNMDYCCGGGRPLGQVCDELGVDPEVVLSELAAEESRRPQEVRWYDRPPAEIVAHILDTYHAPLRPEIRRLRDMALKVEQVHAEKPSCPRGLAQHLEFMAQAVEDHLRKEEEVLFPMIESGETGFVRMPVQMMIQEHDDHAESLRRTRALTRDFWVPDEACTTWRALYLGLEQLERDLMDHIHLENNVLFPKVLNH